MHAKRDDGFADNWGIIFHKTPRTTNHVHPVPGVSASFAEENVTRSPISNGRRTAMRRMPSMYLEIDGPTANAKDTTRVDTESRSAQGSKSRIDRTMSAKMK